ncbi:MMPL family transporter [Levilactobacillus bambusae]|uniref:Multidrug RND transporter n=1 Tax=Levilactobacillus bambusae TaxID=2024736 RepID=A0A2V1MYM0_9LACO|nr:MMPL family transporter [Levilactobacillus bambusae]PWG00069.1 multidrug RND transporter [Levilactobacillus bambusae]
MQQQIHKLHHNRLIALIVWLIIIFASIILLPNINSIIQYDGQPQLANDSQPVQASNLRANWGRDLDGTYTVNAVFNNPDGALTKKQQTSINKTITSLQKNQTSYGIKQLTSVSNTPVMSPVLQSKDRSTQIVQLQVSSSTASVRNEAKLLSSEITTPGVKTYITSPQMVNDANNSAIASTGFKAIIAIFIVSLIIMGVLFSSVVAPFITMFSVLAAYLASLSLIGNLATRFHFAFSAYTPVELLLAVVMLGLFGHFYLLRNFRRQMDTDVEPQDAVTASLHSVWLSTTISTVVLAVAFGSLALFKFSSIRALSLVAVAFILSTLTTLTLTPTFMGLLGDQIFWPSNKVAGSTQHTMWFHLSRFGAWRPVATIAACLVIVGAFAFSYRDNLNYTTTNHVNDQAISGAQVMQAHMGGGSATPVTLYVKTSNKLNDQAYLYQIDNLTRKLQAQKGIQSVASITQPGGQPITQYYADSQMDAVSGNVKSVQGQLNQLQDDLKSDRSNLNQKQLSKNVSKLNKVANQSTDMLNNAITLDASLASAQSRASASGTSTSKSAQSYIKTLAKVNTELDQAASALTDLETSMASTQTGLDSSANALSSYESSVDTVTTSLKESQAGLKTASTTLGKIYDYLAGYKTSEAAKNLYLTPDQIQSGDFQQSLYNYTDKTAKITYLTITLDNVPTRQTAGVVKNLQQVADSQIRGTNLGAADLIFSGQPVVQADIQSQVQHSLPAMLMLIFGIILFALFIVSRSVLQPFYWLLTFCISAGAGLQLGELTTNWLFGEASFDWEGLFVVLIPLAILVTTQLVRIGMNMHESEMPLDSWVVPSMTHFGQTVRHLTFIGIMLFAALFFTGSVTLASIALITIYTLLIFNVTLPLILAAVGKLTIVLPTYHRRKSQHAR